MKKSLIALLALGSMAMGEDTSLFTIAPTTATAATTAGGGSYTSSVLNQDDSIDITLSTPSVDALSGSGALNASNFTRTMFSVATNIGNGGSYTFKQNFHVNVLDGATITLTSLDVDFFAHSAGGQKQTQDRVIYATLTLKQGDVTLIDRNQLEVTIPGISGDQYTGNAYNDDGTAVKAPGVGTFTLPANTNLSTGDYVLTIDIARKSETGTFIGIGHVGAKGTVSQVPEPTTGTLSLLALAGLCARRRRK